MQIHEIEVIIDKRGQVRVEVRGVKGEACLDLTKELEIALGGEVLSRQLTAEAHETSTEQIGNRIWQGSR